MKLKFVTLATIVALASGWAFAQTPAAPNPALDACFKLGAANADKNRAAMTAATTAKKITPDEAAKFKASQDNIAKIHAGNKASGYTLQKCEDLGKLIALEATQVAEWAASPAPATPDPKFIACEAKNRALDAEVAKMIVDGKKAGNISAAELGEFARIEGDIAKRRAALAKDGLSLADCESMTKSYESEKATVIKMAAGKNQVVSKEMAACLVKNKALETEIEKLIADGKKSGNISAAEAGEIADIEARIAKKKGDLIKGGLSQAECESITKSYESEKANVIKMAAGKNQIVSKEMTACLAKNRALDTEIEAMMAAATKAGNISPAEQAEFTKMEAFIKAKRTEMAKNGYTVADCDATTKLYAAEKAKVTKMAADKSSAVAAANTALAECSKLGAANADKNRAAMTTATTAKKITPDEAAKFKASQDNIAKVHAANKTAGYTLQKCEDLGKLIAAEATNVADWVK